MNGPSTLTAPPPAIDPRLRRRRVEVRRREGRRRLRVLMVAVGVTALSASGWLASRSPLLDIDRIEVFGVSGEAAAEVLRAAGIERHQAMTDLHAGAAATRAERLAWVADVAVSRQWPATVVVRVVRRVPVAVVEVSPGRLAQVDRTGLVVGHSAGAPPGAARLEGVPLPGAPGTSLAAASAPDVRLSATLAVRVAAAMPPRLAPRVEAVVSGGNGTVDLRLRPVGAAAGVRVRMGGADRVEEKLMAVQAVLDGVDLRTMATLDVRLPDNPVVTRLAAPPTGP